MSSPIRHAAAVAALLLAGACADAPTTPLPALAQPDLAAVKFWEAGAAVAWNARADALLKARPRGAGSRHLYLAMAQFRAAEAAEAIQPHPPISAAIGGASAAILSSFFPEDVEEIEDAIDAQRSASPWPGSKHADFAAGEAIGREIAAKVLTFRQSDLSGGFNALLPPYGPPPTTPGSWVYNGGPIVSGAVNARALFMTSNDQLRPPPPPTFGSSAFLAALAEVRQISDTRTPEQLAIALYWNANQSGVSNAAMNALARELIVTHRQKDLEAARTLFLMNAANWDAGIGCFEAKYSYWFIRPPQADPGIVTTFPAPPHPSYPSAHSCVSGSLTGVLAAIFPSERARVEAAAFEASISRLYAGIHYRFDMEAGLALGRAAAALALAADLDEVAPLP